MFSKLLAERRDHEQLARDLQDAICAQELTVAYQPIVDARGEKTLGVEALCRWRHPALGDISPAEFIPLAEERGLITPLGEFVLRQACAEGGNWPGLKISVNVSAEQFRLPDFVDRVSRILDETGLEPTRLELEVTENRLIDDLVNALTKMDALRALGVRLALDDFGTGYSSLNYLLSLPFDKLKIDRGFVLKIEKGASGAAIIHSIVSLGRALGMHVTAEGVETAEQHMFLRVAGVHSYQGYRFSRPVDAASISMRLASERDETPVAPPPALVARAS